MNHAKKIKKSYCCQPFTYTAAAEVHCCCCQQSSAAVPEVYYDNNRLCSRTQVDSRDCVCQQVYLCLVYQVYWSLLELEQS